MVSVGRWVMRIAEFRLVDVLAAGALCAHRIDLQILFVDVDVDVFGLGQHGDSRRRCMDAPLRLRLRHALDAMHARFEFQLGEDAAPFDLGDDFLKAAHRAFARRDHLDASSRASSA